MPVARVQLPDGRIARFGVEEGTTPEQVQAYAQQMMGDGGIPANPDQPSAPAAAPPAPSAWDQIKRGLGIDARALISGVVGLPAMGADALAATSNKLLGTNFPNQTQAVQDLLTRIGLPQPQNTVDRATMMLGGVVGGSAWNGPMNAAVNGITGAKAPLYSAPPPVTPKTDALSTAQQEGAVVTPSYADRGGLPQVIEDLAGRGRVQQAAAAHNQPIWDALARKAAGLPPDAPLTEEALNTAILNTHDQGYGPIAQLGKITTGSVYRKALDEVAAANQGPISSFPKAGNNSVADLVDAYRVPQYDANDALQAIKNLRSDAAASFKSGDANLGNTQKGIADAIENNIGLNLKYRKDVPPGLLEGFQNARTQIAKQFAVLNSLDGGIVNAQKLGSAMKNGAPLTDELATIANFANTAPKLAAPAREAAPGISMADAAIGALAGHALSGPLAAIGLLPAAKKVAPSVLLSPWVQNGLLSSPANQTPAITGSILQPTNALPPLYQYVNGLYQDR